MFDIVLFEAEMKPSTSLTVTTRTYDDRVSDRTSHVSGTVYYLHLEKTWARTRVIYSDAGKERNNT